MNKIVDLPPASPAGEPPTIGGLLREAARWGELRKTPYGITPAIVLALVILFISVDVPAYLILLPTIVQDLGLDPGRGIYVCCPVPGPRRAEALFRGLVRRTATGLRSCWASAASSAASD